MSGIASISRVAKAIAAALLWHRSHPQSSVVRGIDACGSQAQRERCQTLSSGTGLARWNSNCSGADKGSHP